MSSRQRIPKKGKEILEGLKRKQEQEQEGSGADNVRVGHL